MDPHAWGETPPPKRPKRGPNRSKTRSTDLAAAHDIRMRELVRPDFVVCFASVTSSLLCWMDAYKEQKGEAKAQTQESSRKAKVRPAFAHGLLCKRD